MSKLNARTVQEKVVLKSHCYMDPQILHTCIVQSFPSLLLPSYQAPSKAKGSITVARLPVKEGGAWAESPIPSGEGLLYRINCAQTMQPLEKPLTLLSLSCVCG